MFKGRHTDLLANMSTSLHSPVAVAQPLAGGALLPPAAVMTCTAASQPLPLSGLQVQLSCSCPSLSSWWICPAGAAGPS